MSPSASASPSIAPAEEKSPILSIPLSEDIWMSINHKNLSYVDSNNIMTGTNRFGDETNYVEINPSGELTLQGTATVWEDLRVPMTSTKAGGSKDPGFSIFRKNGASQGVFTYQFDKTAEEELYFAVQFPHSYKLGTTIEPHVHWAVITSPAGGTTVRWGLEYTWVDINGVFAAPTIIYTTATDPVTQYKHILSSFTNISGTGITGVSSMMLCRIFRDVANDNFDDDAALLEIDFHYEQDTLGSKTSSAK